MSRPLAPSPIGLLVPAVALLTLGSGCLHSHSPRNAPGHVDVHERPKELAREAPETPRDPGERMVAVTAGGYLGGGLALASPDVGAYATGVEASVHYGENDRSHANDDFWIYPKSSVGLNVGMTLLDQRATKPGVGYAELQWAEDGMVGFAGGVAVDTRSGRRGPQFTGFVGPLYLRSTTLLSDGTDLEIGIMVKLPAVWVWSR